MSKLVCAVVVAGSLVFAAGCSSEGKKSDPKPAEGQKIDPRLKPAEAGSGGSPQQNKGQSEVKGD